MNDQSEYISRQSGVADSIINLNSFLNSNIYRIISDYQDPTEGLNSVERFVTVSLAERGVESDITSQIVTNLKNSLGGGNYNWMRYFISCDPADYLSDIECPVLALNGELDCQVLAEKNILSIRAVLERGGNKDFKTEIFPGLNHLFQSSKSGLVDEYGVIEETMSPVVPETIIEWVLTTFR
jgi:hypothetical protein